MNHLRWVVVKNAASNIVRGGATAIVAIALPHFFAHSLDRDRFAAWSLMLQIAAYASVLDFGLQTAVARFIAQAIERQQSDRIRKLIETAFSMLSLAALLALLAIGIVIFYAGSFFHGVPPVLLHEFQFSTFVMAASAALLLPLSTFTGVLIGMHQNEFPALAIGGSRLVGAAVAILAVRHTHSLILIALCVAIPNIAGGVVQVFVVMRRLEGARFLTFSMDRMVAIDFVRYCSGLAVWSFGMLLISGLDVTIVGHFQFEAVGYYAVASTLMTLFASANSSVLSAFLAPFATMQAKAQSDKMREIVLRSTRINTLFNFAAIAVAVAYGERLLVAWVGPFYAQRAYSILVILTIAQAIRLTASSYSIALMATGYQNRGITPAIIEAVANLAASLWAVGRFGPVGVAYGSLIGASIAIPSLLLLTVKTEEDLKVTRFDLAVRGMLLGVLPTIPAVLCSLFIRRRHPLPLHALGLWLLAATCGFLIYSASGQRQERKSLAISHGGISDR